MRVEIKGLRETLNNLSKKESEIIKAAKKANLAGGEKVMKNLLDNVPQSGYSGPNPQARMKNAVTMSSNRTNKSTYESFVAVGFNRSANFRAHIPEFGSISQAPQGYMDKTVQQSEKEVVTEMEKALRGAIG